MRTLPAGLSAALRTNPPYVVLIENDDGDVDGNTGEVFEYTLTHDSLTCKVSKDTSMGGGHQYRLRRGAIIAGVPTYIETSKLWPRKRIEHQTYWEIEASLFPPSYVSVAGDQTYTQVLTAYATAIGFTAAFNKPAAAFWGYQFLPAGRSMVFNDSKHIVSLLHQKYLIQAMDAGAQVIRFFCIPDTDAIADQTLADKRLLQYMVGQLKVRQFLWRDEAATLHTDGLATSTIHNLGYLESTDLAPRDAGLGGYGTATLAKPAHIVEIPINLDIETGDRFVLTDVDSSYRARTVEEYRRGDGKNRPRWVTTLYNNEWFKNTEAGALPGTIEAAAPYTPLNVSQFNGVLSSADNNVQAGFETIDDHTHGYTATDVLAKLLTVDGAGSGIDADLLDGTSSAGFATSGHTHAAGDATTLDSIDSTGFAQLAVANVFTQNQRIWKDPDPQFTLSPTAYSGVIKAAGRKAGLADNVATTLFQIVTANETGSNDGGGYVCNVEALVYHGTSPNSNATPAVKRWRGSFSRAMAAAGTGVLTAVEDVFSGASAAVTGATRDIAVITGTVAETSEYDVRFSLQIDLTGTGIQSAIVAFEVTLIWDGFLTAPVITGI